MRTPSLLYDRKTIRNARIRYRDASGRLYVAAPQRDPVLQSFSDDGFTEPRVNLLVPLVSQPGLYDVLYVWTPHRAAQSLRAARKPLLPDPRDGLLVLEDLSITDVKKRRLFAHTKVYTIHHVSKTHRFGTMGRIVITHPL